MWWSCWTKRSRHPASRNDESSWLSSALANEVAAASRAHARGMDGTRRDIAALPGVIHLGLAIEHQCHFPVQNDVCRLLEMLVVGIIGVWRVLPDVGVVKAFLMQAFRESLFVHSCLEYARSAPGFIAKR